MKLHDNLPSAGTVIKITDNTLLRHAKQQPAVHNRDATRWAQQHSAHMGVSIAIAPAAIMRIGYVSRRKALRPATDPLSYSIVVSAAVDPGTKSNSAPVPPARQSPQILRYYQ